MHRHVRAHQNAAHPHQRMVHCRADSGLARVIVSGKGDAFLISDREGEILENDTGSKFNAKVFVRFG